MIKIGKGKHHHNSILSLVIAPLLAISSTQSQASSMCILNTTVNKFTTSDVDVEEHYSSVVEAFPGRNDSNPFKMFALETEQAILNATKDYFCEDGENEQSVTLNLTVVELGITASPVELERLTSELIGTRSSYVELDIDRTNFSVDANIIWNPRRMLRDQLTLDGWTFEEELPLLPFTEVEYEASIATYVDEVIFRFLGPDSENTATQFKSKIPKDLFGLMSETVQSTRGPFSGLVHGNAVTMIDASAAGYTALTKAVVSEAFSSGNAKKIYSIGDLDSPYIRGLYQENPWNLVDKVTSDKIRKE